MKEYGLPALVDDEGGPHLLRETELVYVGDPVSLERVRSSRDVDVFMRRLIPNGPRELLIALFLDAKSAPTGWYRFSGGHSAVAVCPADILRPALLSSASTIIMCHNHPSGDPTPSSEDIAITERVSRAGEILGIRLLDHVILGEGRYYSFLDSGIISPP